MMKFDGSSSIRDIFETAGTWLQGEIQTDLIVKCGWEAANTVEFCCHKMMIRGLLFRQLGPLADTLTQETEQLLLPEMEPAAFRNYLHFVYGMVEKSSRATTYHGLEREPVLKDAIDELLVASLTPVIQIKVEAADMMEEEEEEEELVEMSYNKLAAQAAITNSHDEDDPSVGEAKFEPTAQQKSMQAKTSKAERQHYCHLCRGNRRGFVSQNRLRHHLQRAHGIVALLCSCGAVFSEEADFDEHCAGDPEQHERLPRLPAAALTTNIVKHVKTENGERDIVVKQEEPDEWLPPKAVNKPCKRGRKPGKKQSGDTATKGPKERKKKTVFICKYCKESFPGPNKRKQHYLEVHGSELQEKGLLFTHNNALSIKKHICEYEGCDRIFRHLCELTDHINVVHKNQRNYICELCSKTFPYRKSLRYHMDIKHDIGFQGRLTASILCPECGDVFSSKIKLGIHMAGKHKTKNLRFPCKFCDFKTHAKNVIIEHERTHTGEKPEICQWCGKGFNAKKTLKNHERLHTGEKPYRCRHCEAGFAQRTSLNVHMASHHKGQAPVYFPLKERNTCFLPQNSVLAASYQPPSSGDSGGGLIDEPEKIEPPSPAPSGGFKSSGLSSYESYLARLKLHRQEQELKTESEGSDS